MVCLVWCTIIVVGLSHHKDVVTTSEGVLEDGSRAEVDIRVVTLSLVGRGSVEVPLAELANVGDLLANGLLCRISLMSREHAYMHIVHSVPSSSNATLHRHQSRHLQIVSHTDTRV